jgi:hypothetical protein
MGAWADTTWPEIHVRSIRDRADGNLATVNPFQKTHGGPSDEIRHVGDLGNFKTDAQGNGKGSISDSHVKLIGENSVIGVRSADTRYLMCHRARKRKGARLIDNGLLTRLAAYCRRPCGHR